MFSPFLKKKKTISYCLFTFGWIFIAARGLFSSYGGYSSHRGGVSLQSMGSRCAGSAAVAHGLSCLEHVGSSRTRDRNRVPCIGRRVLQH